MENQPTQTAPPTRTGVSKGAFNLRDYWKIARGGVWTVLAVFTIVLALVALWTFSQTPVYKSVATVEVRSETRRVLPGQDMAMMGATGFSWSAEERFYNTQIEILRSRDLAERVVAKMGLGSDPMFPPGKDPALLLSQMVRALPRTDTGIIEISMSGVNPKRITDIVNAVADEYVKRNIDRAKQNLVELLRDMNKQVDELSKSTRDAEALRFEEGRSADLLVPVNQEDVLGKQLAQYMDQHTKTRIEVGQLQAILQSVDAVKAAGADLLTIKDIAEKEPVIQLVKQRSDLEKEIEGMRVKYLPSHPELLKKTSELESVRTKLNDQVDRIVSGYRAELQVKAALAKDLSAQIDATKEQLFDTGKRSTSYSMASRTAETKAKVSEAVQSKLNEIAVTAGLLSNNINILDYATPPTRPVRPRKLVNLFMGALCGLFAGIGVVFFLHHLDNTVKSIEDVEQGLELPVLSVIPRYRETTGHAVKEAFQTLKTNVLFSSDAHRRNLLLLTSAGPREGKSTTVINLARTIASAGERVIVVDCDLRRPTIHVHLELERDHGLTNFLTGPQGEDLGKYIKTTKVPNLSVLTCGPIPPNPPELFGGERFQEVLKDLRKRFDWVLLDSPPVISLTDSVILASMADMVAFVVKHNETERDMIRRCLHNIRNANPHVIGAILNDVDIEKSYSKDYYYAGYYYYGGEGEGDKKKKRGRSREIAADGTSSA